MAGAQVEIRGARELRRHLRKAGVDMKQLKPVNKAAGEIVKTAATRTAPVGTRIKRAKTKRLKDTLAVFATTTGARIRAGSKSVPYAGVIHWGWPKRGIKAQPFIADEAKKTEPQWLRLYEKHMEKIIDSIEGMPRP